MRSVQNSPLPINFLQKKKNQPARSRKVREISAALKSQPPSMDQCRLSHRAPSLFSFLCAALQSFSSIELGQPRVSSVKKVLRKFFFIHICRVWCCVLFVGRTCALCCCVPNSRTCFSSRFSDLNKFLNFFHWFHMWSD